MNLVLRGRGDDAEKFLKEITADGHEDAHRWSTVRAANLIWTLGRPADAAAILEGLAAGPETPTQAAYAHSGGGMCRSGVRSLRARRRKGHRRTEFGAARRLSRDDGVVRVGDGARRAGPRRRAHGRRRSGARPCVDVVPDRTSAVLVRRRLRPCLQTDRPHRRLREGRQADGRLRERRSRSGLCEPGVPFGPVRPDARRTARRGQAPARSARRRRASRHHNGFAARDLLRADRGARQTRRSRPRRTPHSKRRARTCRTPTCTCTPPSRSRPDGHWRQADICPTQ